MSRTAPSTHQPQLQKQLQTAAPTLHQYACLRCRSRRVKCDKILSGCANCSGHDQQCVYSARKPRKSQRVTESVTPWTVSLAPGTDGSDHTSNLSRLSDEDDEEEEALMPRNLEDPAYRVVQNDGSDGGRLLINPDGDSHYINRERVNLLASFETFLLNDPSETHEDVKLKYDRRTPEPSSLLTRSHEKRDMRLYHPPAAIMHVLWDFYSRNVDILTKVLYKPGVAALVTRAAVDLSSMKKDEPLLFAIWFATTTAMSPEECLQFQKEPQAIVVRRYRNALESALAQAGWMTTQNIGVLQSITLYLIFSSENTRTTWILSGIALSIAQAMGMHTDSANFSLSPIDVEVRRRVWWSLCQADVRISENCGLQSHVPLTTDTKLPLDINDTDLASSGKTKLIPRAEFTEMTLSLMRMEFAKTSLQLGRSSSTTEEKKVLVRNQIHRWEEVCSKYCDKESEYQRFCALGTRYLMSQLWTFAYNMQAAPIDGAESADDLLIHHSTIMLDLAHILPSKFERHGWFFRCKFTQLHAMAYLLFQMCDHTSGPAVERAWTSIDGIFADWEEGGVITAETGMPGQKAVRALWKPMLRLRDRAREARTEAIINSSQTPALLNLNTPSTPSTGYGATGMSFDGHPVDMHEAATEGALIAGDPFLGTADDFGLEMNWEQVDDWVEKFQAGLLQQDDYHENDMMGTLAW